jgi:dienelactone hydrolase
MAATHDVRYFDGDEALNGMFAWKSSLQKRRPGVLIVHGGAGLDDHARGRAQRFADAGYLAFACDMYGESVSGKRDRVMQQIAELRRDRTALTARVDAAIGTLSSDERFDGRLAVVGYCLGGLIALECARAGMNVAGVVSVHGNLGTAAPAVPGSIKTRMLVCHGSLDPHAPMTQVSAFVEEMNRAGADFRLVVYGHAMHGFTHEAAIQPANGVAYDAAADTRSGVEIKTFLDELFTA